jgi:type III pantothenate kinase
MLLALDVGNTNIVIGVFDGDGLVESWRLATMRERTADEIGILLTHLFEHRNRPLSVIDSAIVASVVPPLTPIVADAVRRYFGCEPLMVEPQLDIGMPVLYEQPSEVGADRLVNGVAAYELYGRTRGTAVIAVDFGTATTFDAISARGEYLGGAICPGIQISAEALFQRAARLPRVDVRKPPALIARTTVQSMQAGLFYGYVAMVEGIVERMRRELAGPDEAEARRAICIATGGMADIIASETPIIEEVNADLTLHGLRIVWERAR